MCVCANNSFRSTFIRRPHKSSSISINTQRNTLNLKLERKRLLISLCEPGALKPWGAQTVIPDENSETNSTILLKTAL